MTSQYAISDTFDDFRLAFFAIFTKRSFKGGDFLSYLDRPASQRGGDEASVVDTAIIGPLLGLLGFKPGERTYNEQHQADRPDFLPDLTGTASASWWKTRIRRWA